MLFLYIDNMIKICYNVIEIKTLTIKSYEMKKVILAIALCVFFGISQSHAQLCGNCEVKQAPQQISTFTPVICEPIAIGSYGRRVGYLKEVPSGILPISVICYLYVVDATGKVYEKAYPMQIIRTLSNPGDWFIGTNPAAPNQYLQPRPIPLTIQVKPVLDANGRQVINGDGTYAVIYDITF
jgi:hypothetical protein